MKKILSVIYCTFCLLAANASALDGLLDRTIPSSHRSLFALSVSEDGAEVGDDFFTIRTAKNRVSIVGNTPVSAAFGLNWYLKYYCHTSLSWCGDQMVLPAKLPMLKEPLTMRTPLQTGFYLNYCTFSYSMPFWTWHDWQREIDRMAMNGITTPMAMVGVEKVWVNTLKEFGYSDAQIKAFLPGPAYMGWFLMGNLQGMGGPMSDRWIDRQAELGLQIATRMREYGMNPVFQSFFGMVPTDFSENFFEADIIAQGKWQGYDRPSILNPIDPLFDRVAQVWYAEYQKLFGTTKYWAGDLFHEGGKTGNMDVTQAGVAVQKALVKANPQAVWVIQSWGANPRRDLLRGLNRSQVLVVDLCAEYWDRWSERAAFEGTPFVWGNITNWGGNIGLHGRLDDVASEPIRARQDSVAGKWLRGTANVPEGIGTNPVVFDLACQMRWRDDKVKLPEWLFEYSTYRYGSSDPMIQKAWAALHKTAYGTYKGHRRPSESFLCARPSLTVRTVSAWGSAAIYYAPQEFTAAVRDFFSVYEKFKNSDTYIYDLVDFSRQVVSNRARTLYAQIVSAHARSAKDSLTIYTDRFMELLKLQDDLLSARAELSLCTWIDKARAAGQTPQEKDQFEYNARALITTWSDVDSELVDYAHREWSGLLRDYYAPRWAMFFDYLNGQSAVMPDFKAFEQSWARSKTLSKGPTIDLKTTVMKCLDL